jgi:glycosyltransferase involved in cell wall biosynthesis
MAGEVGSRGRDRLKILVLCYEYPPVGGGGGRVAAQVAMSLAQRGHAVRVLTAGMRHLPRRQVAGQVEVLRTVSCRRREDTCTVPEMALYLAAALFPVVREVRIWRPDVVHAHFAVPTGPLALAAKMLSHIPYVLTVHLGDVPGGVPEQTDHLFRLIRPLVIPICRNARRVTAVSSFVAGLARKAYGVNPIVILNGVNPVVRPELRVHSPRRIMMVGRLSIQKNPLLAIEALALIKDLDWAFDIVGDGPLMPETRALAEQAGIEKRVTLHGWISNREVGELMAKADILLMTSLQEGLPMVAIEALQRGLAIVGSQIGGLQDVIEEGTNGFLCELSPSAFAQKLRALLLDTALLERMRGASCEKAREFDLQKTVNAYEDVLAAIGFENPKRNRAPNS